MNPDEQYKLNLTRRTFLQGCGQSLGATALASLLTQESSANSALPIPVMAQPP